MNKKALIPVRALYIFTILCAVVFTALRIYMLKNAYSVSDGFYTSELLHAAFRYGLITVVVLTFAVGHIYIKEEKSITQLPESTFVRICGYAAGVSLCGFILYSIAKFAMFGDASIANGIMCLFAFVGLLYFFTNGKSGDFRALFCVSPALMLLAMVFGLYFNPQISYINHTVMLGFAAAIFTMLACTAEANFALSRNAYRRYLSYAPAAVVLSMALSVPDLLYYISASRVLLVDIYYDIFLFIFGIYHFARLTAVFGSEDIYTEE